MKKNYQHYLKLVAFAFLLMLFINSCKKDSSSNNKGPGALATLGLYEQATDTNRRVFIAVTKVGNQVTNYGLVFDTGSTGLTIDANGLLPSSMITTDGIQFDGDSVNVNGITVTSDETEIIYGNANNGTREYGNLAYTTVTLGDARNGSITTSRIPIFLYYKIVDAKNNILTPHTNDVFGVAPGVSFANSKIASPLSYFKTGANIISGFKLARFNSAAFSLGGTYVAGLLTIGLLPHDLNGDGFIMHPLVYNTEGGYSPDIAGTMNYNGNDVAATFLFDTGTPATTILEDSKAQNGQSKLPANTVVKITTANGFVYQYTTGNTDELTDLDNPSYTKDTRTIFSIDFFLNNEYLLDYTDHQIGLKNN